MRNVTIVLGGRSFVVARLPALRAIAWRKGAEALLEELRGLIKLYDRESQTPAELVEASLVLYRQAGAVVEQVIEVVLGASDELTLQRDAILDTAAEDELMLAFQTLLLLNAPLAGLAQGGTATAPAAGPAVENGAIATPTA